MPSSYHSLTDPNSRYIQIQRIEQAMGRLDQWLRLNGTHPRMGKALVRYFELADRVHEYWHPERD